MRNALLLLLCVGCGAEVDAPANDEASIQIEPSPNPIVNGGFERSLEAWGRSDSATIDLVGGRSGRYAAYFGPFAYDHGYGGRSNLSYLTTKPFQTAAGSTSLIWYCQSWPEDDGNAVLSLTAEVHDAVTGVLIAQTKQPCALKQWTRNRLVFEGGNRKLYVSFSGADVFLDDVALDQSTVAITAPAEGAKVSGTISISANARSLFMAAPITMMMDNFVLGYGSSALTVPFDTTLLPNGAHVITANTSDSGGGVVKTAVHIDIQNAPPDTGAVSDGSFELGGAAWSRSGGVSIIGTQPHTLARFDKPRTDYQYDRLWQTITVPTSPKPALTFSYFIRCGWSSYEDARAEIIGTNGVSSSLRLCSYNDAWKTTQIDLSSWKGQSVTVRFSARFWYTQMLLLIDDVSAR